VISERHQRTTDEEKGPKAAHIRPTHIFVSIQKKISVGKGVSTVVAAAAAAAFGAVVALIVVLHFVIHLLLICGSNVLL